MVWTEVRYPVGDYFEFKDVRGYCRNIFDNKQNSEKSIYIKLISFLSNYIF